MTLKLVDVNKSLFRNTQVTYEVMKPTRNAQYSV